MLNGHDVLAKGEKLMSQGFRQDLLESSSVVFGLSSQVAKRQEQIKPTRCWWSNFLRFWHLSKEMNCT